MQIGNQALPPQKAQGTLHQQHMCHWVLSTALAMQRRRQGIEPKQLQQDTEASTLAKWASLSHSFKPIAPTCAPTQQLHQVQFSAMQLTSAISCSRNQLFARVPEAATPQQRHKCSHTYQTPKMPHRKAGRKDALPYYARKRGTQLRRDSPGEQAPWAESLQHEAMLPQPPRHRQGTWPVGQAHTPKISNTEKTHGCCKSQPAFLHTYTTAR